MGNLIVEKKDENGNLQSDVGFIISTTKTDGSNGKYLTAPEGTTLNGTDMFYSNGWSLTETDKNKATVFYTGENGKFRIYNLPKGYYNISEVYNHYKDSEGNYTNKYIDYDLQSCQEYKYNRSDNTKTSIYHTIGRDENIKTYDSEKKYMQTGTRIWLTSETVSTVTFIDKSFGNLIVEKKDENGNLQNDVGFVIYSNKRNGYLKYKTEDVTGIKEYKGEDFEITEDINKATIFITGNTGSFSIKGIPESTYKISEVYNHNEDNERQAYRYVDYDLQKCNLNVKYDATQDGTSTSLTINKTENNIDSYNKEKKYIQQVEFTVKSGSITTATFVDQKRATLIVEKRAETESGTLQSNVGFIISKDGKYLKAANGISTNTMEMVYSDGWSLTETDKNKATVFVTNTEGKFEIINLPLGTYKIEEVYSDNSEYKQQEFDLKRYTLQVDYGTVQTNYNVTHEENMEGWNTDKKYSQAVNVDLSGGGKTIFTAIDTIEYKPITLHIEKKNGNSTKAEGVKFKIYKKNGENKEWIKEDGANTTVYTQYEADAKVFTTNEDEYFETTFKLDSSKDEYYIKEIENPNCDVNIRYAYLGGSQLEVIDNELVKVTNLAQHNKYNIVIYDEYMTPPDTPTDSETTQIGGIVFYDYVASKDGKVNGLYGDNYDKPIQGAKVELKNKYTGEVLATATTVSDGKYTMNDLPIFNLDSYYLEFDLSETEYKNGRYVKTLSVYNNENGSKGYEYNPQSGIGRTYIGEDAVWVNRYGIQDAMKKYMNFGLTEDTSTESIYQTIDQVNISVNGKNFKYYYDKEGKNSSGEIVDTNVENFPTVNFRNNNIKAYTRDIYPSDIAAFADNNAQMKVQVTYAITIKNNTKATNNYQFTWSEGVDQILYSKGDRNKDLDTQASNVNQETKEDNLYISKLTETIDNNRYKLSETLITTDDYVTSDQKNWDANLKYNSDIYIVPEGYCVKYITLDVQDEEIKRILENPDGIIENQATTAEITGYHNWYQYVRYGNEENTKEEKTDWKTLSAEAPYCIFKLNNNERTISGKVFKDNDTNNTDHELLGNGKYDENKDKPVSKVKVDIYNSKTDKLADIYQKENNKYIKTNTGVNGIDLKTDENGKYSIKGIVADDYYIVYTYGDGTQKISEKTNVYSSQYKSTILNSPGEKEDSTLNYTVNTAGGKWYLNYKKHTMAVDNIDSRTLNDNTYLYSTLYEGLNNDRNKKLVDAHTPSFEVGIEFTNDEFYNNNKSKTSYNDMYFGIIEQPKISIDLHKNITYVSITLSNGQILTQGDPSDEDLIQYIATLDTAQKYGSYKYGFGRGGYVKAEIDTNYLYGSTLEITYTIEAVNTSDVNYKTKDYYYYGKEGNPQDEYTVFIDEVYDYLDPEITYIDYQKSDLTIKEVKNTDINSGISLTNAKNAGGREYSKYLDIIIDNTDLKNSEMYSIYSNNKKNQKNSHKKVIAITASKLLSNEDDDLEFKSVAEVVKITTDKQGGELPRFMAPTASTEETTVTVMTNKSVKTHNDLVNKYASLRYRKDYKSITTDVATITLTPPTGTSEIAKNNYIIFATGIGLIIVLCGIVIIKKKVL